MNTLQRIFDVIKDRQAHPREGSYTAHLFEKGSNEIAKKVGEEAVEVVLAAAAQGRERLTAEVADLAYHVLVLLAAHDLTPGDIAAELEARFGGHHLKEGE